jgi:predicted AAA+ superfamily ATPase
MRVRRDELLDMVLRHEGTPEVKVLVGVRRCGKSTLLQMFADALAERGVSQENMFFKRFDAFDIPIGYGAKDLYDELRAAMQRAEPGMFYVFLDEIQDVPGWEQVVRRLHTRENTDVYVTGSNARLLSGELATYLAGRYVELPVYPLSFAEYAGYRTDLGDADADDRMFADYMRYGGMPGLFAAGLPDEAKAGEVLDGVYQSVVLKDVAQRYGIRDLATLEKVSRYLFSTSGNLFSTNRVRATLRDAGLDVTYATLDNQIGALQKTFVLYSAGQERTRGKQLLRPRHKYYPVDNGFRNLANGFSGADRGAQLEGIVFMELKRRGYAVSIGQTPSGKEIDFVARKGEGRKMYVQVTASMLEEGTRVRELAPLQELDDAFPRVVLTMDWLSGGVTEEGIRISNVTQWLREQ